ncbi:hypothetical protein DPMN_084714 [Dreissena polymorpha]|uniref:Uncharacterized protein n=1 Tax=Dreissena polymorpha TaxID=45954 RepID=A0A9D4BL50_DREPO|nr:hypothetical protein DPMN_084714 [Dreissena polymorpha]
MSLVQGDTNRLHVTLGHPGDMNRLEVALGYPRGDTNRLHVTLGHPGDMNRLEVTLGRLQAISADSSQTGDMNRFEVTLGSHETNVLSKFHENWAKNVTFTVFTCFHYIHIEKNAPPIFKFPNRENCHYIHIEKNAPPTGGYVFSLISTIFELVRDIN